MSTNQPWQLFSGELVRYALDHLHRPSEFDQIVGFLLLDIGVETLFKVFLMLPEQITTTNMSYTKRKEAAEGNFHELVRGVETAAKTAGNRLAGINLGHVEYFHGLRNKLYHAGNGITVQGDHAEQYASIAMDLLDRLLGVDLKSSWQDQLREQQELDDLKEQLKQVKTSLRKQMYALEQDLRLAIEKVEPALVMPSFERETWKWKRADIYVDPTYFTETTMVETGAEIPGGDYVSLGEDQVTIEKFKGSKLRKLMPPVLQQFVDKHNVEASAMARLLTHNDYAELLLLVAEIVFQFPVDLDSSHLALARIFPAPQGEESIKDWLKSTLDTGKDLVGKIQKIHAAIKTAEGLDHEMSPSFSTQTAKEIT